MHTLARLAILIVFAITSAAVAQSIRNVGGCSVRPGTICANMNLRGIDLSNANLRHSQFTRSVLAGANLSGANLDESNLSSADLRSANLSSTLLRKVNARAARFD